MHVKKLSYRRFHYTRATGQTENTCCVNRVLIKLVPLKGICVKKKSNFDSPIVNVFMMYLIVTNRFSLHKTFIDELEWCGLL